MVDVLEAVDEMLIMECFEFVGEGITEKHIHVNKDAANELKKGMVALKIDKIYKLEISESVIYCFIANFLGLNQILTKGDYVGMLTVDAKVMRDRVDKKKMSLTDEIKYGHKSGIKRSKLLSELIDYCNKKSRKFIFKTTIMGEEIGGAVIFAEEKR